VSPHEALDIAGRCRLPNKVSHVDGVEIAGVEETVDGFEGDVVGVAEVFQLPIERLDSGIGGLSYRRGFGADDLMLAVRLIPYWNDYDPIVESLHACLQLCFSLVREPVSCPNGILAKFQALVLHVRSH